MISECNTNSVIKFRLWKVVSPDECSIVAEEDMHVNFGLPRRTRLSLIPTSDNFNSYSCSIFLGWSKCGRAHRSTPTQPLSSRFITGPSTSLNSATRSRPNTINEVPPVPFYTQGTAFGDMIRLEERDGELPYNWYTSASDSGDVYYIDRNTNTTYITQPGRLPPGWEILFFQSTNRIYYHHIETGQLLEHRPTAENLAQMETADNIWAARRFQNRSNADRIYSSNDVAINLSVNHSLSDEQIEKAINNLLGPLPFDTGEFLDVTRNQNGRNDTISILCRPPEQKNFMDRPTNELVGRKLTRLNSEIFQLPEHYDIRFSKFNVPIFIDCKRKKTSILDPRNELPIFPSAVVVMSQQRTFRDKMIYFRNLCKELTKPREHVLTISKARIMEDSKNQVMASSLLALHQRLAIKFDKEEGIDYGGLSREWMYEVSHQILNPHYCLFLTRGALNDYIFEINPMSSIMPDYKQNFNFIGRIIGLALFHSRFLDCSFSKIFYKKILGRQCTHEDIQQIDIEFYNSVDWLLKNNIEEAQLEMYFCMEMEYFGEFKIIELKPDGASIKVTEENKHEYIDLLVDWKIHFATREQMKYIIHGIAEIIPLTWLRCFSVKEFEMLLCGIQEYDLEDWKKYTRYYNYSSTSPQILWFWEFVSKLSPEEKGKLLHFVTGTTRVPSTGFKDLMGSNGVQRFLIQRSGTIQELPRSHTCFNRLDLPPYETYEQLSSKLIVAMHEVGHFLQ